MIKDIISPLLVWLNAHPELAGLVTFIISAGESVAIIGTIVPGSIMMTALGTLAGAGIIPLWQTIFWAIMGAIVGDSISYWIGHYFKERLPTLWPFRHYPNLLQTGERFFHKYGSMSVFIGRFVGPVRALVPMVAGMLGMTPLRFTIANIASAIGWGPAYMLPGILLGAASLELPPDIAMHVIIALLLIVLFILLCLWFAYKLTHLVHRQLNQLQNWFWNCLKNTRYLNATTHILKYHNHERIHGQLNLAFLFLFTSLLLFGLAAYVKVTGPENILINQIVFHLFRGVHSDTADNIMLNITLLGQKQVIFALFVVLFSWLIMIDHKRSALHTLALGVITVGSVYIIKHLLKIPRPWGIIYNPEAFSFPSGHTTLATATYMGLAFTIALGLPKNKRWFAYLTGALIAFLVGCSRLYLGAHWFTDVLGGWLLSAIILTGIIISFQRHTEKPVQPIRAFFISIASLFIIVTTFQTIYFDAMKINYEQIPWPTVTLDGSNWWQTNGNIPATRTSLFGVPSQHINIEWVGDLNKIRDSLLAAGWQKPPARDWVSTLHRLTDIDSEEYLPLVSPQYLDKKPALILTRIQPNNNGLIVIRLWDANRLIKNSNETLWVGFVGAVPRSYSWLYKKHAGDVDIDSSLVLPQNLKSRSWEWKTLTLEVMGKHKLTEQKILLIRKTQGK